MKFDMLARRVVTDTAGAIYMGGAKKKLITAGVQSGVDFFASCLGAGG